MIYLITISFYLIALTVLGLYKAKKVKTQSDFALAGRSLGPWVLVGTMLATWVGTGSIFSTAGKVYQVGVAGLAIPLGGVFGVLILTQIAGKVRGYNAYTVPEILGIRYGNGAKILGIIALTTAYLVIVSYQFNAGGAVLETILTDQVTGVSLISQETATLTAAIFIVLYTVLAGLLSVAYTDFANGIIIVICFAITLPFLYFKAGGLDGMQHAFDVMDKSQHMDLFGVFSWKDIINFTLPPFLLILGDANMYQRFSAADSVSSAKKAAFFLVFAILLVETMIAATAWVGSSMISDAANGKYVLIYTAWQFLPTALGVIMLTTLVGIIITTADSFLLVPVTTLIHDVYVQYINPKASEKHIVLASRLLVLALGGLAFSISKGFASSASFFEKAMYAYTIYGAAITPSLFAALFWNKATKQGAITSMAAGMITTLLWSETTIIQLALPRVFYEGVDEVLPAISVSIISLIVVSLMTQPKTVNHEAKVAS